MLMASAADTACDGPAGELTALAGGGTVIAYSDQGDVLPSIDLTPTGDAGPFREVARNVPKGEMENVRGHRDLVGNQKERSES